MIDSNTPDLERVVLSGMRPTGKLHIGHVEGVLGEWVQLQDDHRCYYFVADLHALTTTSDTAAVRAHTIDMVKDWIAAGVDPRRSTLFLQSHVPEHGQLATILGMLVHLGRLERLPTFTEYLTELVSRSKDERRSYDEVKRAAVTFGFLGYPVLQAADILLYGTTVVPVGEDQLPHIELTRELARRFNGLYGDVFRVPSARLGVAPRILGTDGRKMSKSYSNTLEPTDSLGELQAKVRTIASDPARVKVTLPGNPADCRVFDLQELYSPILETVRAECTTAQRSCADCKRELAASMAVKYDGYRDARAGITDAYVIDVLNEGTKTARLRAVDTLARVRDAMGLSYERASL